VRGERQVGRVEKRHVYLSVTVLGEFLVSEDITPWAFGSQ